MYYAWHDEVGLIRPNPKSRALCPSCKKTVIAKCGDKMSWHWAHEVDGNCEKKNKGPWHSRMQSMFDIKNCEVSFTYNGETRRADVVQGDCVYEFQDSHITQDEITARDKFYRSLGKYVAWIIRASTPKKKALITIGEPPRANNPLGLKMFRWDSPPMSKLPDTRFLFLYITDDTIFKLDYWTETTVSSLYYANHLERWEDYERRVIYGTGKIYNIKELVK